MRQPPGAMRQRQHEPTGGKNMTWHALVQSATAVRKAQQIEQAVRGGVLADAPSAVGDVPVAFAREDLLESATSSDPRRRLEDAAASPQAAHFAPSPWTAARRSRLDGGENSPSARGGCSRSTALPWATSPAAPPGSPCSGLISVPVRPAEPSGQPGWRIVALEVLPRSWRVVGWPRWPPGGTSRKAPAGQAG